VIATQYANLCDLIISPTDSIKRMIRERGVRVPVEVIPTGIDVDFYAGGKRSEFRRKHKIPRKAFVLGYLGRVVEAKNMAFVTQAAVRVLTDCPDCWFLIAGEGDAADEVQRKVRKAGVADRVVMTGSLQGRAVADAYAAMDLFVFASKTETQGIVLCESLSAGVPVIALNARGTRDILLNGKTGSVLDGEASPDEFSAAIRHVKETPGLLSSLCTQSRRHACTFDRKRCAAKLLSVYRNLRECPSDTRPDDTDFWPSVQERFSAEWDLFKEKLAAFSAVAGGEGHP